MRIVLFLVVAISCLFLTGCKVGKDLDITSEQACVEGLAAKCTTLGIIHAYGPRKNIELSETYFARGFELNVTACDKGDMDACGRLGSIFYGGYGVEKSIPKALELFKKTCDSSVAQSCNRLGGHFLKKSYRDLQQSKLYFTKARQLFHVECSSENQASCNELSHLLERGFGGPVDTVGSFEAAKRACVIGRPRDCYRFGHSHARGIGTEQNVMKAAKIFHKICLDGEPSGCFQLGYNREGAQGVLKNHPKQFKFFQKKCSPKDGGACYSLSVFYRSGNGVEKNEKKASSLLQLSCDYESAIGCESAAIQSLFKALEVRSKVEKKKLYFDSLRLADKSCDLGSAKACELLTKWKTEASFTRLAEE